MWKSLRIRWRAKNAHEKETPRLQRKNTRHSKHSAVGYSNVSYTLDTYTHAKLATNTAVYTPSREPKNIARSTTKTSGEFYNL
jgi:hypothetical protein